MNNIFSENINFNDDPTSDLKIEMQSNLPSFYTSLRENIFNSQLECILLTLSTILSILFLIVLAVIILLFDNDYFDNCFLPIFLVTLPLFLAFILSLIVFFGENKKQYVKIFNSGIEITCEKIERGSIFIKNSDIYDIVFKRISGSTPRSSKIYLEYRIELILKYPIDLPFSKRKLNKFPLFFLTNKEREFVEDREFFEDFTQKVKDILQIK